MTSDATIPVPPLVIVEGPPRALFLAFNKPTSCCWEVSVGEALTMEGGHE